MRIQKAKEGIKGTRKCKIDARDSPDQNKEIKPEPQSTVQVPTDTAQMRSPDVLQARAGLSVHSAFEIPKSRNRKVLLNQWSAVRIEIRVQ